MKIAIVCASGIGDALIFHPVAHALSSKGLDATIFSPHLPRFGSWIKTNSRMASELIPGDFDAVFLQHDNRREVFNIPTYTFYGVHLPSKHGKLKEEFDYICDRNKTMVENVDAACAKFFGIQVKEHGFSPPAGLIHRRFKRRIAIHPTGSALEKRWPKEKFLKVRDYLLQVGYDPVFTVSPEEAKEWESPLFPTLGDLASFLYESGAFLGNDSGPGHLASLLQIPHLIIAGDGLQMPLWRTGWLPGHLAAAPPYLMRFKAIRNKWKSLITENKVIKILNEMVLSN